MNGNYFTLRPDEAYRELLTAVKGKEPVDAVFHMSGEQATGIIIRVDGAPINTYITLYRDGAWGGTYYKVPIK